MNGHGMKASVIARVQNAKQPAFTYGDAAGSGMSA